MNQPSQDNSERRESKRHYRHGSAKVTKVNDAAIDLKVQVMNISDGGVRIVVAEEMTVGTTFSIILDDAEKACKVVESKQLFEGWAVRSEYV